jgi:hypothetical protein
VNWRALSVAVILLCSSFLISTRAKTSQRNSYDALESTRDMVIRMQAQMEELDRRMREMESWKDHYANENDIFIAEHRELQVKVEAHERILWGLVSAFIVLLVAALFRLFKQRMQNGRMSELLNERGKRERAEGRREGLEAKD